MKGNFQLISIIVFVALAILGVLVFSGAIPIGGSGSSSNPTTVTLWGTTNGTAMTQLLNEFNDANPTLKVVYVQKSANTFDQDILEALANGTGPDMVFIPDNLVFHYANKLVSIPFASYPLASFKTNFASAGEVFLTSAGILAFPITIDPLVMYYNRSQLDANSIVTPPATWDDLSAEVPTLTKKDDTNKIIKSAVALGQFSNVAHAKDILSALFMQVGNPIVTQQGSSFQSALGSSNSQSTLSSILKFFISFTDPSQGVYSWNKSFVNSRDAFSAENLTFYFGYASELPSLVNANPNENFSATAFPQLKSANFKLTNAHVTGLAILSSSKNINAAFTAASLMATGDFAGKFSLATGVPPARRDLLLNKPNDAYSPTFYNSALFAKSWLDPSTANTDDIFSNMIESVLSNRLTPEGAISDAGNKLGILLLQR